MTDNEIFALSADYIAKREYDSAIRELNKLDHHPAQHQIMYNFGLAFKGKGDTAEAIKCFQEATALAERYVKPYIALAETYHYTGEHMLGYQFGEFLFADQSLNHFSEELMHKRLDIECPFTRLALNFRFDKHDFVNFKVNHFDLHKQILKKIEGKIIYVAPSQGLGDIIQAFYHVRHLLDYNPKEIVVGVPRELLRLFWDTDPKIRIAPQAPPVFDYFIPCTSVPKLFNDLMIPKNKYLYVQNKDFTFSKAIIQDLLKKNNIPDADYLVGINWKGNPNHVKDSIRSISLERMISEAKGHNRNLVSIQYGATEEEKEILAQNGVIDVSPYIRDLCDTAGFVANLDVLATIDSAPAHLGGAIGTKTLCYMPFGEEDYRWGNEALSRLYSSLKIIRFELN